MFTFIETEEVIAENIPVMREEKKLDKEMA